MPNLATQVTKEQIEKALEHIITNKLQLKGSTKFDLIYKGQRFPPKEVVRWAARLAGIPNWSRMRLNGGDPTNGPLQKMGFEIGEKTAAATDAPLANLIKQYKVLISQTGFADEIYKWKLVQTYKGRPNLEAEDFGQEIRSIKYSNLIYGVGIGAIHHIARERPEEYRTCFQNLVNDQIPLQDRIDTFHDQTLAIYRELNPNEKHSHHHDERTTATFLTYYNPFEYTFYKDSFYRKLCKLLDEPVEKRGKKYVHYLSIVNSFISDYIEEDQELLGLVEKQLHDEQAFQDPNHKILAQDILYRTLEKNTRTFKSVVEEIQAALNDDELPIKFRVLTGTHDHKDKREWVWLADEKGILGDVDAHYELEYDESKGNNIEVCIHFEDDNTNNKYSDTITEKLPNQIKWYNWFGAKSLKHSEPVSINDENVVTEIIDRLIYLDQQIGDRVREVKSGEGKTKVGASSLPINGPLNIILYGPPGTGKTYTTVNKALEILGINISNLTRQQIKEHYNAARATGQIVFTTFHQSMSYEDFIEGIKPETIDGKVTYSVQDGIFKQLCNNARIPNQSSFETAYKKLQEELTNKEDNQIELKTPRGKGFAISLNSNGNLNLHTGIKREQQGVLTKENLQKQISGEDMFRGWDGYFAGVIGYLKSRHGYNLSDTSEAYKRYVLIIDEINRGNVSQIFGELITLLEEDKREGQSEALEVTLPYSKEKFSVPSNLYIIGTMNTADRSVEALDTALRRRFCFEEMLPDVNHPGIVTDIPGLNLQQVLSKINRRLEKLISRDHTIGHSYFMHIKDVECLYEAFYNKIIPLLQEYFFGDYGKIGLVLGAPFVEDAEKETTDEDHFFADFKYEETDLLLQKKVYRICKFKDALGKIDFNKFLEAVKGI